MPFAVPRALPLSLLAAFVLAGCAEKKEQPRLKRVKNHWMWQALCGKNARQREGSQCVGGCLSKDV